MIMWAAVGAMAAAFVISLLATRVTKAVAHKVGMIDVPRGHKTHARPIPLLGGSAIFLAMLAPSLLALSMARVWAATGMPWWLPAEAYPYIRGAAARAPEALILLAGAAVIHVVGLIDDRRGLGPLVKLLIELAVAAAVTALCPRVRVLTVAGPTVSYLLTMLWITAITNAFNFMDNMDGLSAGVAAICAAALLAASANMGQLFVSAWLCLLFGSLCGFLPHNFPPAGTFMGDAGSLVVGYMLAVLTCLTTYVPSSPIDGLWGAFVPLVLMAVPLYDMTSVILIRIRSRVNPMVGDRRHFSHRLLRRGMSVRGAVLTVYLCTAGTAIAASLLPHVADATGACLVFAQTFAIILIIAILEAGDSRSG